MLFHQRHSFFPLVLAGLTIVLVVFMFYAFTGQISPNVVIIPEAPPVSDAEYQDELTAVMSVFIENYQHQTDNLTRLVLVEQTLEKLLTIRVPADRKEVHLSLAVELNQMQQALRERSGEEQTAFDRIKTYVSN